MTLLIALRWIELLVWLPTAVWLAGSATRNQFGRGDRADVFWALAWLFAALQSAWAIRNVAIGPALSGALLSVTYGLHVLSILVALAILWKRWQFTGWRW